MGIVHKREAIKLIKIKSHIDMIQGLLKFMYIKNRRYGARS